MEPIWRQELQVESRGTGRREICQRLANGGEACAAGTLGGIKYQSNQLYGCLTAGSWTQIATAGSSAAGGANTQVQFNNGGVLGGSASMTWATSAKGASGAQTTT